MSSNFIVSDIRIQNQPAIKMLVFTIGLCLFNSVFAQTVIIDDNIDSYVVNDYIGPQSIFWTTWSGTEGGAEDAFVSDEFSASGNQSVKIEGGGSEDVLLLLGDRIAGVYTIEFDIYIPAGKQAYYNMQHFEIPGIEWASELYFNTGGVGNLSAGGASVAIFSWTEDSWIHVSQMVDLNADWTELTIDGNLIHSWTFSDEATGPGGTKQLGAFDFFPADGSYLFYLDNIRLIEDSPPLPPVNVTFTVDMSEIAVAANGVHLVGDFQGWDPAGTLMTDLGDGNWQITLPLPANGSFLFKYLNGSEWPDEELLTAECGLANGLGGYNRELQTSTTDSTLENICFAKCTACVTGAEALTAQKVQIYPNPADEKLFIHMPENLPPPYQILLFNNSGKLVHFYSGNENTQVINTDLLEDGMYFGTVWSPEGSLNLSVLINH